MDHKIIDQTREFVKKEMQGDPAHDWSHIYRVWRISITLAKKEKADSFTVQLAALLHDLDDWKLSSGEINKAKTFMEQLNLSPEIISNICEIIEHLSFKGAGVETKMSTKEGMVVQDADRLDAIGAIGIARAFSYGGKKNSPIYDPELKPEFHTSFEDYKKSQGTTINHFYEKLLILKELMNTDSAKKIAEKRHKFMEKYLNEFFKEWEGKA